jgi:tetratricopeptide (TPR) repeat protein
MTSCKSPDNSESGDQKTGEAELVAKTKVKTFWEHYRTAQNYRTSGDWQNASEFYIKALETDPHHEDAWFNLGNMYLEMGQAQEAISCWDKILEENTQSARAHMQLGRLYISFDRPETFNLSKAEYEFKSASNINRVITAPNLYLGHVSLINGNLQEAKKHYESNIGTDVKNVEAYFLLGYLAWKNKDFEKAHEYFNAARMAQTQVKKIGDGLSEGDTKDGVSYVRPINQSIFFKAFMGLKDLPDENVSVAMTDRYVLLDEMLEVIRTRVN